MEKLKKIESTNQNQSWKHTDFNTNTLLHFMYFMGNIEGQMKEQWVHVF